MPKYTHPFIKHIRHECKRYGMKFILVHQDGFKCDDEDTSCGGYFSSDPLELGVATMVNYKDFLSGLVHEFSHFEQWRDESPYFLKEYKGMDAGNVLFHWLQGKEYKKETINTCIDIIRDCELDCDRRAVENIRKFKLPLGIKEYCKKSSGYIYFHNFVKISRNWEYKNYPSCIPQIYNKMPDNLDGDYSTTPRRIMKLFKTYLN